MRTILAMIAVVMTLALAACGGSSTSTGSSSGGNPSSPGATTTPASTSAGSGSAAATISMGATSFTNTTVSIKAGQSVTFDDPSATGGTHILVTGNNGQFSAESGAPAAFNSANGTMFSPGTTKAVTFSTPGTYRITCTIHPSMEATVTVTS